MHLGKTNPQHSYSMGDENLTVTSEEKDLGVTIDDRLEFDVHIKNIINRANRLLGLIKIGFSCLDKDIFLNLYTVLVRPLLEYCVQVWSPYKQMYINQLEKVQDRATRLVPGLKDKTYEKRLEILGLTTLVERRFRGDMLQAYKMVTHKEDINPGKFFKFRRERGDPDLHRGYVLDKSRHRLEPRGHTFSQRVVWPHIPLEGHF